MEVLGDMRVGIVVVVLTVDTVTLVGVVKAKVIDVGVIEVCVVVSLPAVHVLQAGVEVLQPHVEVIGACAVDMLPGVGDMAADAVIMLCVVVMTDVVLHACVVAEVAGVVAALQDEVVMQANCIILAGVVVLLVTMGM